MIATPAIPHAAPVVWKEEITTGVCSVRLFPDTLSRYLPSSLAYRFYLFNRSAATRAISDLALLQSAYNVLLGSPLRRVVASPGIIVNQSAASSSAYLFRYAEIGSDDPEGMRVAKSKTHQWIARSSAKALLSGLIK